MKKSVLISLIVVAVLVVGTVLFVRRDVAPTPPEGWLTYGSPSLGFSIQYPNAYAPVVSETADGVMFSAEADDDVGVWVYDVTVSSTSAKTTQEWIESQSVGDAETPGVRFIKNLERDPDVYVYTESVQVDTDGDRPIYGQFIKGAFVSDGKLFIMQSRGYKMPEDELFPDADFSIFLESFRVLEK